MNDLNKKLTKLEEQHKVKINNINNKKLSSVILVKLLLGVIIGCGLAVTAGLMLRQEGLGLPFVKDNYQPLYKYEERVYAKGGMKVNTEISTINNNLNEEKYMVVRYLPVKSEDYPDYKDYLYVMKCEKYLVSYISEDNIKEMVNNPTMSFDFLNVTPEVDIIGTNEIISLESYKPYAVVTTPYNKVEQTGISSYNPNMEANNKIMASLLLALSILTSAVQAREYQKNFSKHKAEEVDEEDKRYTKRKNKLLSKNTRN